jgi:hypothetical protein
MAMAITPAVTATAIHRTTLRKGNCPPSWVRDAIQPEPRLKKPLDVGPALQIPQVFAS